MKISTGTKIIFTIIIIVIIVILIVIFFKGSRDNADNIVDIFGEDADIKEFKQVQDLYNLSSLKDYRSYNPCIFTVNGSNEPFYVYRMCNFILCPGKQHKWDSNNRERTKSYTFIENPKGELFMVNHKNISKEKCEVGGQDARAFVYKDMLCLVCNVPSGENCRREMVMMTFKLDEFLIESTSTKVKSGMYRKYVREVIPEKIIKLNIDFDNDRDQKNWMPFVIGDDIYFVYSVNPHVILKYDGKRCIKYAETITDKLPTNLRGGSQIIRVKKWNPKFEATIGKTKNYIDYRSEDLFLGVIHTRESTSQYVTYIYAFEITYPFKVKYITKGFIFGGKTSHSKRIQFASGIARIYENNISYMHITYGENDCDSKYCIIKEETMLNALIPINKYKEEMLSYDENELV